MKDTKHHPGRIAWSKETLTGLINRILDKKRYLYGLADLRGLLTHPYDQYPYGISIARKLDTAIIDPIKEGPNLAYYQHYRAINQELTDTAETLQKELFKHGINSKIIPPTLTRKEEDDAYRKSLKIHISHKMVATRAGLGWIGKTALFISPQWGPRLRLVSLLTSTPLDYSRGPVNESRCGDCRLCVDHCPAEAASGWSWNYRMKREDFFDPFKCRAKCRELGSRTIYKDASICGICVSICPLGKPGTG